MLYKLAINNPICLADVMVIRLPVCLFIVEELTIQRPCRLQQHFDLAISVRHLARTGAFHLQIRL
jgi:hypothetical protein